MGVEGFRWLSQDKELGSRGMFLLFVSLLLSLLLSLSLFLSLYVLSHPKGLIYNPFTSHTAVCDNGSE